MADRISITTPFGEVKQETARRGACFDVSYKILADALHFPEGTQILSIEQDGEGRLNGMFRLVVTHPDLPTVNECATMPVVSPTVKISFDWGID